MWRGEGLTVEEVMKKDEFEINQEHLNLIREATHRVNLLLMTSYRLGILFVFRQMEGDT